MSNYRRSRIGQVFFFTVVTHQRQKILTNRTARIALRAAIRETQVDRPFKIVAICLLPDHLHTIWELPHGDKDYSRRWGRIKSQFTKSWLETGGHNGPRSASRLARGEQGVWQRRFSEHTCRDELDLKRCVDYIHINPLKHGYVNRVVDWPWSSFHRYIREGEYSENWGDLSEWDDSEFDQFE